MDNSLSKESPLIVRILAWMEERFPFKNFPAWVVWYLLAALVARFSMGGETIALSFVDILGAVATWSFFLLLRVFDEHKDYELDLHNYPERVLQSGLITLTHLKFIGVLCVVFQILWAAFLDGGFGQVFWAWLIMFFYSLLMAKEFFVGEWLEKRLVLYAISHQIIIPLTIWWMCCLGQPDVKFSGLIFWLMALSFATSMTLEIVRKTRGPDEERDTVDSYSKVFGTRGSAWVVISLASAMFVLMLFLAAQIVSSGFYIGYGLFVLAYVYALTSLFKFLKSPSLAGREKNEVACALLMLIGYVVLIAGILSEKQIQFTMLV
ncbi:MAG: UbiA family prenyltransferase [Pseudomonadales bacterium]|nr:UbiA family prenyltransferase [Pseudomonadales bacterium]